MTGFRWVEAKDAGKYPAVHARDSPGEAVEVWWLDSQHSRTALRLHNRIISDRTVGPQNYTVPQLPQNMVVMRVS